MGLPWEAKYEMKAIHKYVLSNLPDNNTQIKIPSKIGDKVLKVEMYHKKL